MALLERRLPNLKAFYHRIAARRGKKRAALAVAHKQTAIIYHEMSENKPYKELGENFFDRINQRALEQRLVRRLRSLGYRVDLHPEPVTPQCS